MTKFKKTISIKPIEISNNKITTSIGIETLGGVFTKIIEKNTTVPTKISNSIDHGPGIMDHGPRIKV